MPGSPGPLQLVPAHASAPASGVPVRSRQEAGDEGKLRAAWCLAAFLAHCSFQGFVAQVAGWLAVWAATCPDCPALCTTQYSLLRPSTLARTHVCFEEDQHPAIAA